MLVLKRILIRKLLVAVLLGMMFSANAQNKTYIANHKLIAALLGESYGIPAPLILAVATIESSGGKGPAAKVLNNHFGIEGENDYVNKKGHSSRYKQYVNEWASYLDFCQLLTRKRFYNKLKGNPNPKAWVHAMSLAHYSEIPEEWENKVLSVLATIKMPKSSFFASVK
jgi:flagellum-specific peptidoglycan hydrolase FlgJ